MQVQGPMEGELKLVELVLKNGNAKPISKPSGAAHISNRASAMFERCCFLKNEADEGGRST